MTTVIVKDSGIQAKRFVEYALPITSGLTQAKGVCPQKVLCGFGSLYPAGSSVETNTLTASVGQRSGTMKEKHEKEKNEKKSNEKTNE